MKIIFINLSLRPDSLRRHLPVGLAYVLTAVKKAGFEFDFIDMDIDQLSINDLENVFSQKLYDVYAFGCIVTGFRWVKEISKVIKSINQKSIIIAGNSVATSIPEILLPNTEVDVAVLGEGDITIVELLRSIDKKEDFRGVKGLAFLNNEGEIVNTGKREAIRLLDLIGFPDWNIFNLDKYSNYGKINANTFSSEQVLSYPLNSARGCPYQCTFCYHVFKNDQYRKYSELAVVEEIKRLHDQFSCNFISFWDELTFHNISSVKNMLKWMSKLRFEISWEAVSRADLFKKDDISLIKEIKNVGAECISFSLENADQRILNAMNKKLDVSQFIDHAKALWEGGVTPLTSVIFGYPQETRKTIEHTIKICEECNLFPSVGFLLPLPGTPIYEWARQNGFIENEIQYLENIGDRQDFHINLTQMEDDEFIEIVTQKLTELAQKQGLELESVFKTTTYQKPKTE